MNNRDDISQPIKLSELVSESTVETQVRVENWQEAVAYVGNILLLAGKIQPRYITAMEQVLTEIGPYAVIAPGVVLLHARPEDGVIQPCLGVITLAEPIPFGHTQNDPVFLVLALGAIDKKSHIYALQQLGNFLGDQSKLNAIRIAKDRSAIISLLSEE